METSNLILLVQTLIIAGIGLMVFFQNRILKTQLGKQNEIIEKQSTIINNLESYSKIINVDEFRKFVDLKVANLTEQANKEKQDLEKQIREEVEPLIKQVEPLVEDINKVTKSYAESLSLSAELTMKLIRKEDRLESLISQLPNCNPETIEQVLRIVEGQYEPDGKDASIQTAFFEYQRNKREKAPQMSPGLLYKIGDNKPRKL